ncbi:DUF4340 domain-containing protein [Hydrogenoanaerobacterium sp.]|uniref:DUF4340 domain-containing protein n=1 Tax=Hydrogenoanaerobacterium sp. TaxID=2953763 RepID=UPI0028975BB4|nr:DUF4340 domain-containing protein [Hydrogenoanaerobacterium sp.]
MSKQLKGVILAFVAVLLLVGGLAAVLMLQPQEKPTETAKAILLEQRPLGDLQSLTVTNAHGTYHIRQEDGGFLIEDIPTELVNGDYLQMAVEEATTIAALTTVEKASSDLSAYGLSQPEATVEITYTDGETIKLAIGAEEQIADARYFTIKGDSTVYLMDRARTIRFTMPVTKYIQYEITPTRTLPSPLSVIKNITFSGSSLPEPIVIREVRTKNEEEMRQAASFGVATHVIVSPVLHELDQTSGGEVFQSLLGLMSEGVVDYNCDEAQLAAYGFDKPWLEVEMEIQNGGDAPIENILLRISHDAEGNLICTKNTDGVVYKIRDVAFTKVAYEKLVMRWFLTPFITDLTEMTVASPEERYTFTFLGDGDNKKLGITCNGKQLDVDTFRKYYQLVISAANDGTFGAQAPAPQAQPLLTVTYRYRDAKKPDDVMKLYPGGTRRVWVEVNGIAEFTMRDTYTEKVLTATQSLLAGGAISTEW